VSPHLTIRLHDTLSIWMGPGRVRIARARAGIGRRRDASLKYGCSEPAPNVPLWQPAAYALEQLLAANPMRGAAATLTLSNHFVRFILVPASAGASRPIEHAAVARAAFHATHGPQAEHWKLSVSSVGNGHSSIAAAVDASLIETINGICASAEVRLNSIRPFFTEVFNASRSVLPTGDFWFAVAERDHVGVAFARAGDWELIRGRRTTGPIANDLQVLLDQARFADGVERPASNVYLHAAGRASIAFPTDSPWRIKSLARSSSADARSHEGTT
jgi:hypothetical protein